MKLARSMCLALALGTAAASSPGADQELLQRFSALEAEMRRLKEESSSTAAELTQQIRSQQEHIRELEEAPRKLQTVEYMPKAEAEGALNATWLILCGALVMFMQAGFAMVECGACRAKNVQNILMKNLVDVTVGTMCWYAFGWMIAYGGPYDAVGDNNNVSNGNNFMGTEQYFGHEFSEATEDGIFTTTGRPLNWFFQWAFCSAAATIVSGGVAERVNFPGYLIYTICMTTFIYPVVVAWTWGYGWLSGGDGNINGAGYMDFAGSGIVHMTGGVGALIGAICVGPRTGRFDDPDSFAPHSLPLIVLGTFILWFGWYGFNCGSTLGMADASTGAMAAMVAMNTTIAASAGGLTVLLLRLLISKKYDIGGMCNGILAGLVSITAGCGNVESGSALIIGILGGLIYQGASSLLQKLKVDDPIDAFAVHGAAGAWGVMAAVFFDFGKGFDYFNGWSGFSCMTDENGCASGMWAASFAANLVEVLMIFVWVGGLSALVFVPLRLTGMLRAQDDVQEMGMDTAKHSPTKAYNLPASVQGV